MTVTTRKMRLTPELVARVPKYPPDGRPELNTTLPPGTFEGFAQKLLASAPSRDELWVFAFGSLIWKPLTELDPASGRPGIIRGWHRAFCLGPDTWYRGNPEHPSVALSLDRGGQCRGVAYRIRTDGAGLAANVFSLVSREPPLPATWVTVTTTAGPLRAFVFTSKRGHFTWYGDRDKYEVADLIAAASGHWGTAAEYLHNTVRDLEAAGIHDAHLWEMQDLVAQRLEQRPTAR